jgi:hypothetical protein
MTVQVRHACLLQGSHTWTAARLDDKDILPSHALFNLHPGLPDLELAKEDLCGRDAEVVADGPAPSLALRFVTLLPIAMLEAVGGEAARTQSAADASSRRARQCCGPWRRLERWWGASRVPFAKGRAGQGWAAEKDVSRRRRRTSESKSGSSDGPSRRCGRCRGTFSRIGQHGGQYVVAMHP